MAAALSANLLAGPLICPDEVGLCSWERKVGWSPLWKTSRPIQSYWSASNGAVVLLIRGHQDSGRIVVLTPEHKVALVRELGNGVSLAAVSAETPSGGLIICQDTPELSLCDSYLTPTGQKRVYDLPLFPTDCLYPRFLRGGAAVCATAYLANSKLLVEDSKGGFFKPVVDLPDGPYIKDLVPHGEGVLILIREALYFWEPSSTLRRIQTDPVWWVSARGGEAFIATALYDESQGGGIRAPARGWSFTVSKLRQDLQLDVVWSSNELAPWHLTPAASHEFLLDASWGRRRQLIHLTLDAKGVANEKVVWSTNRR